MPLAAGKLDAALKTRTQNLVIFIGKLVDHVFRKALQSRGADAKHIAGIFDASDGDVFRCGHFIAHEILEDHANFAPQIFRVVLADIHAIQQNLAAGHVIKPRKQLHDRGLPLAVFAHQRDALPRCQCEINVAEHRSGISWVENETFLNSNP